MVYASMLVRLTDSIAIAVWSGCLIGYFTALSGADDQDLTLLHCSGVSTKFCLHWGVWPLVLFPAQPRKFWNETNAVHRSLKFNCSLTWANFFLLFLDALST